MLTSHGLLHRSIDFCGAIQYVPAVAREGTPEIFELAERSDDRVRRPPNPMETAMNFSFIRQFLRDRRVYLSVIRELSTYTDRELQDLGIDRADIEHIARSAVRG